MLIFELLTRTGYEAVRSGRSKPRAFAMASSDRLHGDLAGSGVERTSHQHLLEAYHAQSPYIKKCICQRKNHALFNLVCITSSFDQLMSLIHTLVLLQNLLVIMIII